MLTQYQGIEDIDVAHEPARERKRGAESPIERIILASGKPQVRVMPDEKFGLIRAKAGVITLADGRQTAFLGSVNESLTAWRLDYEPLSEDGFDDAVRWVQDEFGALWHPTFAIDLSDAVVQDIKRLAERTVIRDVGA